MKLFDLHCDTLLEAYYKKVGFTHNGLHIDLSRASYLDSYGQVLAVYSEHALTPEQAYLQFHRVMDYYESIAPKQTDLTAVFGVEGGALLDGKAERLGILYGRGVRILTLVWADECCIGGAHNTHIGLHPFGRETVEQCFALGILPDVSHASKEMTHQVLCMAEEKGKPILASHSCFSAVHRHTRNLSDDHAKRIANLGGMIGVNLVREHLTGGNDCTIDTVVDHLLYGVSLCGREAIGLGCDFDGTDQLPDEIAGIGDLEKLYDRLSRRAGSEDLAEQIFYDNAASFLKRTVHDR